MKSLIAIEEAYRPLMRQALLDKDYKLHGELRKCMAAECEPHHRAICYEAHSWPELKAKLAPIGLVILERIFWELRFHPLGIYLLPPEQELPPGTLHLNELSFRVSGGLRQGTQ